MRASVIILLLCIGFYKTSAQVPDPGDAITSCDAVYVSETDPLNPMIIHFHDQSAGQIKLWQWSFGDGSTSTTQNPTHTYAVGGTYFVCLTVSNSDSGNICHDVLCNAITIHEPGACVADYHYAIDPVDLFKTHFTDQSSGNINGWHWDFGDGSFSYDRNPTHIFPSFGKYRVCLTAYNVDSVSVCNDVKCDSVEIKPPAECHAHFSSRLDTLNPAPNTFIFNNTSTGDPNKYLWSFDDGASYDSRNVIHHFQSSGLHQVCLVIKREEHGAVICRDSVCQTIATAKYFDLGGHLFAGEFPINNPISTGDTGVAYLYRVDGTKLIPFDTSTFTHLGYYTFPGKLNGSYIVKAALTAGSDHYLKYYPTYFHSALTWKEANPINLTENNVYLSDIQLFPINSTLTGAGVISGTVVMANSKSALEEIPFAEVILYDEQIKPVFFTMSGKSGQFELNNLPYGMYYVSVEYPGKYARLTSVWLDASTPVVGGLRLEVFNHDVTAVPDLINLQVKAGDLFPNPATNSVSFTIETGKATSLKFEIRTLTGLTIWAGSSACSIGKSLIVLPLASVNAGLYLFVIEVGDGSPIAVKKLLKF